MAKTPKEDPVEKQERLRQRRVAELDRRRATKDSAESLTSDIRNVFGLGGVSMFKRRLGIVGGIPKASIAPRPVSSNTPKTDSK